MAITPDLLARMRTLDDLHELVAALGFSPVGDELGPVAREQLGFAGDGLGVSRAAIVARHGPFVVYGAVLARAGRPEVAHAVERLARAIPGERNLLLALDTGGTTLAAAAVAPSVTGFRARQLRIPLERPSAVMAEILGGLAPRARDSALSLSLRVADALADEGLTSRFFREFARLHGRAAEALGGMPRATGAERRDLALVILTRVLFLYFVQAKGWLGGRSDFLPSLLDAALARGHPFHRSVFEPLCFGALSAPAGSRSAAARRLGGVPFLNGGLFERHVLERRFPTAFLPDETWRDLFDELFERFHFTVRESEDDAVDPEMLGRVFEGLMAEGRRRTSGTYFTPRPLLTRLVAISLRAALENRPSEAVRELRVLDPAVGSGAFLLEALAQIEVLRGTRFPDEPPLLRRRAIVRDCLFGVDLDPMAVRLAELRLWLALVAEDEAAWNEVVPLPNLDQNLRQGDSLLSPLDLAPPSHVSGNTARLQAVAERRVEYFAATGRRKAELARSIRADERAIAHASADAAIASLTARLADAASAAGRDLFGRRAGRDEAGARRVATWRRRRRELIELRRRLSTDDALPFFSFDVHFGGILAQGGFDLVIGNPPWVRGERVSPGMRAMLQRRYRSFRAAAPGRRGFSHLPDLSVAFVERAVQLARPRGVVGFVLPAKLLRAGYAAPLRAMLRESATIVHLEDRSHAAASGFAATVFPMLCALRRDPPDPATPVTVLTSTGGDEIGGTTTQHDLPLDPQMRGAPWLVLPRESSCIVRRVLQAGPRLTSLFRPRLGVKTGANEVFVRDLHHANELPDACRVPAIQGRDIRPFAIVPSAWLLAALDELGNPLRDVDPGVAAYIATRRGVLARRADARHGPPWMLFRTDLLRSRWLVLWRDIAGQLEAAALERRGCRDPVPLNTCYGVSVPDEYTACWLSAWLNSSPMRATAAALAERASGGVFRFSATTVGQLPVPSRTDGPALRSLAAIGGAARRGQNWSQHDLDAHVLASLGLEETVAGALRRLDAALRRDAGRDC
ncbi:MAG: Eco57I restriction-modification methylase domain-containing protein [Gemmatimonadales bacterium]